MNKMKLTLLMLGLAACSQAVAQKTPDRPVFYIGGSLGKAEAKEDACSSAVLPCDRKDTSWGAAIGLMFNRNWGTEIGYRSLGKISSQDDGAGNTAYVKARAVEVLALAALPVDPLTFYGKFGIYRAKLKLVSNFMAEDSNSNTGWTYGVGMRWDLAQHFGVLFDWQRYNSMGGGVVGFRTDVNVLTLGAVVRF